MTTSVEPAEAGTVTQTADQIVEGEAIRITATPNEHWQFIGWAGDLTGTDQSTVYVHMDQSRSITALFEKVEYPVTVDITGEGDVTTEIISQKSITQDFPHATVLKLTAEPVYGWEFVEWGGDVTGSDPEVEVEVDGPVNVTALFERVDFTLTVNVEGNGDVVQEIIQAKTTETDYPYETLVQLTAVAEYGWEFDRWTGDITGTESVAIVDIQSEKEITAHFKRQLFTLDIDVIGGEGHVQKQINGAITSQVQFPFETEVTLTAVPETGWAFNAWALEDNTVIQEDKITVQINSNRFVRIDFFILTPTLPTVVIYDVDNLGESTATVRGNVVDQGSAPITDKGFVYTTTPNPTLNDLLYASAGAGDGAYSVNLTGLTPGKKYYVSPYAVNQVGTTSGPGQLTFTTKGTPPSSPPPTPSSGTQVALVFLEGVNFDVTLNGTLIPASRSFDYRFGVPGVKVVNLSGNIQSMVLNPNQIKVSGLNNEGFGWFYYKMVNKNSTANLHAINANDDGNPEFWGQPASVNPLGVINSYNGSTVWPNNPDPKFYLGWLFDPVKQPNNRTFETAWSATGKMVITFDNYGVNHTNPIVP